MRPSIRSLMNRVTSRPEGGDDGYCWAIRVDGRPVINGLTRTEASYYRQKEIARLAEEHGYEWHNGSWSLPPDDDEEAQS